MGDRKGEVRVAVATVTYGDRAHLCTQAVSAALRSGAFHVVVVDNGSSQSARQRLEEFAANEHRVRILDPRPNRGSAVGFTEAIEAALGLDDDFVWLLDDDNIPRPDALNALLEDYNATARNGDRILFSLRSANKFHAAIAQGVDRYPRPGSFMNLDLGKRLKLRIRSGRTAPAGRRHEIPYGPYGGLFAPAEVLRRFPPPRKDFFLYEDDIEFTLRLAKGHKLLLCTQSVIDDIDAKWSETGGANGAARFLLSTDHERLAYAVRNRAMVDRTRAPGQRIRYVINRTAYMGALAFSAVRWRRIRTWFIAMRAITDGERLARKELLKRAGQFQCHDDSTLRVGDD